MYWLDKLYSYMFGDHNRNLFYDCTEKTYVFWCIIDIFLHSKRKVSTCYVMFHLEDNPASFRLGDDSNVR